MAYQYADKLPKEAWARYRAKLDLVGLEMCPYKLPGDSWINNPSQWPRLEYPDVYSYLIRNPGVYTMEAMANYRSLEAYKFFVSGWVQTVFSQVVCDKHVVLRAAVKPSWRVTEEPHNPWVALTLDGVVVAGHCDCMAGLGETCSHVAALLFKVEAAVRMGYCQTSCTDELCKWNACFVSSIKGAPVSDIRFYDEGSKEKLRTSLRKRKLAPSPASTEEQQQLLASLASEGVVGLCSFADFNAPFVSTQPATPPTRLPSTLRDLYKEEHGNLPACDVRDLCQTVTCPPMSSLQLQFVEETTRAQTSSIPWHNLRAGRITGSTAHAVLHTTFDKPSPSLIKRLCTASPRPLRAPAVTWGQQHEDVAFKVYSWVMTGEGDPPSVPVALTTPPPHHGCKVRKAGLYLHPTSPALGASPDGVVVCACCGEGVVEVKCPYTHRHKSLKEAAKDKDFVLDMDLNVKQSHPWYTQIQMEMLVCGVEYVDLVLWTTVDCMVVRVPRNKAFTMQMEETLLAFWQVNVLPELLTRQLERGKSNENDMDSSPQPQSQPQTAQHVKSPPASSTQPATLYCICRTSDESGDMVACDSCDEWYHLRCLGLTRLPKKKNWYCKDCRKGKKRKC